MMSIDLGDFCKSLEASSGPYGVGQGLDVVYELVEFLSDPVLVGNRRELD